MQVNPITTSSETGLNVQTRKPSANGIPNASAEIKKEVQENIPNVNIEEQIKLANKKLNEMHLSNLSFDVFQDNDTGKQIITLTDKNTDEIIFQIPTKGFIDVLRKIEKSMGNPSGSLINTMV